MALNSVSFVIDSGERLALVGENGAGKTTLVKLLLRLYEPTFGEILVNGRDIRSYTLESLRLRIAVTFQDFLKLALSAKENIGLGFGVSEVEGSKIVEAAVRSGAHEKIISLPKGYNTCLGRGWEDDGVELSGGEWQKVALARSLIKNASLLVLDEPTAALDARSEFKFFQELFRRERKVSLFLISHRFSSVRVADRILVLENGRLVEEGKHEDLMNKKGLYFELYELQTREIS
jgi:ATP-binding cassette subfamily B protein